MRKSSRREFLKTTGGAGLGVAALGVPGWAHMRSQDSTVPANSKVQVLSIGVVGSIGAQDRHQVASHPAVQITGLCDVDSRHLETAKGEHPDAFTCKDYREAFANHAAEFDAVIVSTPDHTHASIMTMALAAGKHVYGQKPLVHQLEELVMIDEAMQARPDLMTQVGNQRMVYPGRRAAVELLRSGVLGKAIAAYAWTSAPNRGRYFNYDRVFSDPVPAPAHIDWDLWQGPCDPAPYREHLLPLTWRSWWEYGSGGLGDWGVHLLDVIMYSFDELQSPVSVKTHAPAASDIFHTYPCQSTVAYAVNSERFANKFFPIYFNDSRQEPSRSALGLPPGPWPDGNMTVVVCEGGVLSVTAGGRLEIWRDGQVTDGMTMEGLPEFPKLNHWHAWVDNILGKKTELRTPFPDGVRITEVGLLGLKAARFPGQELAWDRSKLLFTNHEEASQTIVRRAYRDGFAPTKVG